MRGESPKPRKRTNQEKKGEQQEGGGGDAQSRLKARVVGGTKERRSGRSGADGLLGLGRLGRGARRIGIGQNFRGRLKGGRTSCKWVT
jgi:hypothetical protein